MDRFAAMSTFIAVIDAGSFSAAARQLGMPLATVSRRVSDLEDLLQVGLINRSTRKLTLTQAGENYYQSCRRLLDDLGEAERRASGEYEIPRGDLVITAPLVFGHLHLTPVVVEFLRIHPEVDVQLLLSDDVVTLPGEQIDLALRISHLPDSSMATEQIGTIRRVVCASPDYLTKNGTPQHPDELDQHDCITRAALTVPDSWPFRINGKMESVPLRRRLAVTTAEAAISASIAGAGLARVLCYQVRQAMHEGKLATILHDFEPAPLPLSLVYAATRAVPLKLRAFLDFAVPRLRQRLSQE
ncbi:MAG TPA: LysR family transcriptional regulator [Terriglobia bacterium]|nr:LysR family transcriptional regulator [Terriglobia bacterium]